MITTQSTPIIINYSPLPTSELDAFGKINIGHVFTYIPCILILSKLFYSPTDAQVNCLKNKFKIYIKIDIKTAATCFGAVTPSSGSALFVLAKVTVVKIAN